MLNMVAFAPCRTTRSPTRTCSLRRTFKLICHILPVIKTARSTSSQRTQLWDEAQSARLQIQEKDGSRLTISFDLVLRLLHLLEEPAVADDARCVPDLSARLVETRDDTDDGAFCDVGEVCDLLERLEMVSASDSRKMLRANKGAK